MHARSSDHSATRSGAIARRAGIVTLAAALVAVPLAAAAPASAAPVEPFPITSVAFDNTALMYGDESQASFNGDPSMTRVSDTYICVYEYRNGEPSEYSQATPSYGVDAPLQRYEYLTSMRYTQGDVYTVAYGEPLGTIEADDLSCVVPPMDTPGLPQASLTLTATPEAPPLPEIAVSAAPLNLTQGVAFDVTLPITAASAFDFTDEGGYIDAGPPSSAGYENGELYPYAGIEFGYSNTEPGVAPTFHIVGTPEYAGTTTVGFEISDRKSVGYGTLTINVANKAGIVSPISIEAAVDQPVAGANVTIIQAGLQEGAAWSATVRSTPIIVGSGTIALGGQLATTVTIPAGLEAGTHSITVESTNADGTAFSTVLYFTVSATGTLLAVSTSAAELAATGQDIAPSLFVAGGLLLAGAAFASITVIRRRRNA